MADYFYRDSVGTDATSPLFVVLHGTGGDENQFFDLASDLLPGSRVVAPRGDVSEGGALRYFRRTGEGVYDMVDLARATEKLVAFIRTRKSEGMPRTVIGLGYSNGANILASAQFANPGLFNATILMHPLIPFVPPAADFSTRSVLLTAGQRDPIAPAASTQALHDYFRRNGAEVRLAWHAGGHELRQEELIAVQDFLAGI